MRSIRLSVAGWVLFSLAFSVAMLGSLAGYAADKKNDGKGKDDDKETWTMLRDDSGQIVDSGDHEVHFTLSKAKWRLTVKTESKDSNRSKIRRLVVFREYVVKGHNHVSWVQIAKLHDDSTEIDYQAVMNSTLKADDPPLKFKVVVFGSAITYHVQVEEPADTKAKADNPK